MEGASPRLCPVHGHDITIVIRQSIPNPSRERKRPSCRPTASFVCHEYSLILSTPHHHIGYTKILLMICLGLFICVWTDTHCLHRQAPQFTSSVCLDKQGYPMESTGLNLSMNHNLFTQASRKINQVTKLWSISFKIMFFHSEICLNSQYEG